jgi:hypothetical protein
MKLSGEVVITIQESVVPSFETCCVHRCFSSPTACKGV